MPAASDSNVSYSDNSDIEMIEVVDRSRNNLHDDDGVINHCPYSPNVDPINVDEVQTGPSKVEDMEKALNAAQDSLVKACLRIQELEQLQATSTSNFDVMQIRMKLLKCKLSKSRLRSENKKLKQQLTEAEELYSVMKKRNEELVEEIKALKTLSFEEPTPKSSDSSISQEPDPLPSPSKSAPREPEFTCILEKSSNDPRKFIDNFVRFRKRHSIIPRDLIEYWNSKKMTSKLTHNEVLLFESKRLKRERAQEIISVFQEFLSDLSRGALDLNSFQNKKYRQFSPEAVKILKKEFELNSNPSKAKIESLASQLRVNAVKIRSWFRERRRPLKDK